MKKIALLMLLFASTQLTAQQELLFEDGTKINVNSADFSYQGIRKSSAGFTFYLDGLADLKMFSVSHLNPERFLVNCGIGVAGITVEGTFFFTGRTKEKRKTFSLKYEPAGYREVKAYVLKTNVEKRKEIGAYLNISDYGNLYNIMYDPGGASGTGPDFNNIGYKKLTIIYAGISTVNYWHVNINIDDDAQRRGQYVGRVVLAPFIAFGGEVGHDTAIRKNQLPAYGGRLMYELTNTAAIFGKKSIAGRISLLLRIGGDYFVRKEPSGATGAKSGFAMILGGGLTYHFN